jgi:hypothetical protein
MFVRLHDPPDEKGHTVDGWDDGRVPIREALIAGATALSQTSDERVESIQSLDEGDRRMARLSCEVPSGTLVIR